MKETVASPPSGPAPRPGQRALAVLLQAFAITRRHLRGPLLLVLALLIVFAALERPDADPRGLEAGRRRLAEFFDLAAGGLFLLAAILPLASLRMRRERPVGLPGRRAQALACLSGHALVLAMGVCLIGLLLYGLFQIATGAPAGRGAPAWLRTRLGTNAEAFVLGPETEERTLRFPADEPLAGGGVLRLEPRTFLVPAEGAATAGSLSTRVRVTARHGPHGPARVHHLELTRGRPLEVVLESPPLGAENHDLHLRLTRDGLGHELRFEPRTVTWIGPPAPLVGSILRAVFAIGLAALGILALTQWLSGFVSFPVAVAAALTGLGLAAAFDLAGVPAWPEPSPAAEARRGLATGWGALIAPALQSLGAVGLAVFAAHGDHRLEAGE